MIKSKQCTDYHIGLLYTIQVNGISDLVPRVENHTNDDVDDVINLGQKIRCKNSDPSKKRVAQLA